jgi:hypothetical protein
VARVFLWFSYLGFGELDLYRLEISCWYVHVLHFLYLYEVFQLSKYCVLTDLNLSLCYLVDWVDSSWFCTLI